VANKAFVVQYLIKAREQYVAVANKVRKATKDMREEVDRTRAQLKKYKFDAAAAAQSARNWGLGVAAATGFVFNSLKNSARDAQETRSKFATVFASMRQQAEATADNLAKNFGLAGTAARALLGDTGDLLSGFGFSGEAALEVSRRVNELAVDLASFTNFSGGAAGASAALTKALLGERESVKSLGIAILDKDVKARIALMRSKGQRFESERQAIAYATLELAVEQSKNAIGDFARTQHELANQERITASSLQDLKEKFGRALLPVALKVTQAMRSLFEWLSDLSPATLRFITYAGVALGVLAAVAAVAATLGLAIPAITAAFAVMGTVTLAALGPVLLMIGWLALQAYVVMRYWGEVKTFFSGLAEGIRTTLGPTLSKLTQDFRDAARVVSDLFGDGSEAQNSLRDFSDLGELVGNVVGGVLDALIRGLSGIGAILGQVVGAVTTLDFSQFDGAAIVAEFTGQNARPAATSSRVDVGLNVGLAQGLQQLDPATVSTSNTGRADIGVAGM